MIIVLGALVGFIASFLSTLLGGGSALITIPAFYYITLAYYSDVYAIHVTITTLYAISIVLSTIASYKHYRLGNISFTEIKGYLLYIAIGAILGAVLIKSLDTSSIKRLFAIILLISAFFIFFQKGHEPLRVNSKIINSLAIGCGFLSTVIGVTTFVTIFFVKVGMSLKKAIANTSVCILLKSVVAIIILSYGIHTDIPDAIGYLNIPLFLSAAPFAILGSLSAVKFFGKASPIILKRALLVLMFMSSFLMFL